MNPRTFALILWGILSLYATPSISNTSNPIVNSQQPSLLVDFDQCVAFNGGSQFDYSEFTAVESNFSQCSQISLVSPSNVFRSNIGGNAHSCAPGIGNSRAMCIDASPNCNYEAGSVKSLRFNVQVIPSPVTGIGSLDGISFFDQAPDIFTFNLGEQGVNNYPQFIGVRVLVNGTEIFRQENISTQRFWDLKQFDFSLNDNFQVTSPTVFNFEILPYCPVGNGAQRIIWDIDQLMINGNCNDIFSGTVSTDDITDICSTTGVGGVVEVDVAGAIGPLQSVFVTDDNNNIIQFPSNNTIDFRALPNGIYNIYNIAYEPGLVGLNVGNNLTQLIGCFDLSTPIFVNNSNLRAGNLVFDDGFIDNYICDNTIDGNNIVTNLTNSQGTFTTYLLLDRDNNIIQTFGGPHFDFSSFPEGLYNIIAVSHNGQFFNSVPGANISDLSGCFVLSNPVRVIKQFLQVGSISLDGETQLTLCGATTMSLSPDIDGTNSTNVRWVVTSSAGFILNIFNDLPINISNFSEPSVEIRLLTFVGRLTNFRIDSLLSDVEGCFLLSNPITINNVQVDGGSIALDNGDTSIEVCIDDGINENLMVSLTANVGSQSTYLILDANDNILNISTDNIFNFENVPPGVCTIVHLSSEGTITGLTPGNNISQIDGCFDISNGISVTRLARFDCVGGCNVDGGILTLSPGLLCSDENGTPMLNGQLADAIGNEQEFVIADTDGNIIIIFNDFPIDLTTLPDGDYVAYNIASFDDTEIVVGDNIDDIDHDCFDVSDPASFSKVENISGNVSLSDGTTSIQICVGDTINDVLTFINDGSSEFYQYVVTDSMDIILNVVADDTFDFNNAPAGTCRVWGVATSVPILIEVDQPIGSVLQGPACIDLSGNFIEVERFDSGVVCGEVICDADGGTIILDTNFFCVGDGMEDLVNGSIIDTVGNFFDLIVTDADSTIISLPESFPFDVEDAPAGVCLIWSLATTNDLDLQLGLTISEISDTCFDISEPVAITRTTNFGGFVSLEGGITEIDLCVGDTISDLLTFVTSGEGINYQYVITDTTNIIVSLPSGNEVNFNSFPAGVCRVYGLAHNSIYTQTIGDSLELPSFPNSCFEFSENFIQINRVDEGGVCGVECIANGGVITISAPQFCVGDGEADLLDANIVGELGDFMQWIITDEDSTIIALPADLPVDLDAVPAGSCILWNLASTDMPNLDLGQSIADIDLECFSLSDANPFVRIENFGGTVSLADDAVIMDVCVTDTISDLLTFFNEGSGMTYRYVITDENDTIVALPLDNTFDFSNAPPGICRVYGIALQNDIELFIGTELIEVNDINNCIDISSNFIQINRFDSGEICGEEICVVDGGELTLDNTFFCVGDDEADLLTGTISGATGNTMQLIVTDADSIIIGLPMGFPIDVENSGPGNCIVWNLASRSPIELLVGSSISSIQDSCFSLSNGEIISRVENIGGTVSLENGDQSALICVGDSIANNLTFINTGSSSMYSYIVTDSDNVILGLPGGDMVDFEDAGIGVCRLWGIAHTDDLTFMVGDTLVEPENINACFDLSSNFVEVIRSDDMDACDACVSQRNTCTGGDEVGYIFDDADLIEDTNVCIPLKVTNFNDIITFQGGFMWNPSVLLFTGTQNYALAGMNPVGSFNIDTLGGIGSFVWFDNSGGAGATTLADSSTVFEICFDVIGEPDDKTLLKVIDTDDTIIQVSSEAGVLDFCVDDGCVTVIEDTIATGMFTLIASEIETPDTTVCVDVRATNFNDISGMQFTMQWDSTFMCFDSIANNNTAIGIFSGAFFQDGQADRLRFTWNNLESTLPDSTILFSVCLTIKEGNCDGSSVFNFIDDRVPIEISMGTTSIPFDLNNGSVSYVDCTSIVGSEDIAFVVAPNPSNENISVIIEEMPAENHSIIVHNAYGQMIYNRLKSDITEREKINVSEWPEGIYYMTIASRDKKSTEKFIVIH